MSLTPAIRAALEVLLEETDFTLSIKGDTVTLKFDDPAHAEAFEKLIRDVRGVSDGAA